MKASEILITGACEFVGRRLAARIQIDRPGSDLRCLAKENEDRFCRNEVQFLLSRCIKPLPTDLTRAQCLEGLQSPDLLSHLPGLMDLGRKAESWKTETENVQTLKH